MTMIYSCGLYLFPWEFPEAIGSGAVVFFSGAGDPGGQDIFSGIEATRGSRGSCQDLAVPRKGG